MNIVRPRLTEHLIKKNAFSKNPLLVVDIGARGGPESHWLHYKNQIQVLAFEPDERECEALNRRSSPISVSYYPRALHKDEGTKEFYEMSAQGSSFYRANQEFVKRFPDKVNLTVKGKRSIGTTTLDSFLEKNNFSYADFIKVDTEGSELDILQGSKDALKKSVLGISCEVLFVPWRENKVVFSNVERFLYELGFKVYDLSSFRYARKSLPGQKSVLKSVSGSADWGQIIVGQALFFRDPIEEIQNRDTNSDEWDEKRIYKMVTLFEIFGLPDCAIELMQFAEKENIIKDDEKTLDLYRDLTVKSAKGVTYAQYQKKLEKIKKRGYINLFDMLKARIRKNDLAKKIYSFIRKKKKHV